jgi:hypothetical protein
MREERNHEPNHPDATATEEWPTLSGDPEAATAAVDGLTFDDPDDEWAAAGPARGIRLRFPVLVLVAVILLAAGFWGGAFLEKGKGSSGSTGAPAGFAGRLAAGGARTGGATGATGFGAGAGGAAGFGGTTTPGTTGTISVVDGNTLYVLTSSGSLVKVKLDSSTTVTRNANAVEDELRPGDTVVVQGAAAKNGTVTATSLAATAAGVTTAGGGRGFGGGAAATTGG